MRAGPGGRRGGGRGWGEQVNHWQHRQADYAVAGPAYGRVGVEGIVAAGFWGPRWEWRPDASYAAC